MRHAALQGGCCAGSQRWCDAARCNSMRSSAHYLINGVHCRRPQGTGSMGGILASLEQKYYGGRGGGGGSKKRKVGSFQRLLARCDLCTHVPD